MNKNQQSQPDLALTLDFSGIITAVNVGGAESEDSLQSWVGKQWTETVDSASKYKVARLLDIVRVQRITGYSEINQQMPDGSTQLLEFITVLTHDKQQQIVAVGRSLNSAVAAQAKMLEFQKSMERELWKLREFETRYQALFNISEGAVIVFRDQDLTIVELNDYASEVMLVSSGSNILQVFGGQQQKAKLEQLIASARQSGKSPIALMKLGLEKLSVSVSVVAVRSSAGLNYLLQITPQERIQLRDQHPQTATASAIDMLDSLPHAIVAIGPDDFIAYANAEFDGLIGHQDVTMLNVVGQQIDLWLIDCKSDVARVRRNISLSGRTESFIGNLVVAGDVLKVRVSVNQVIGKQPNILLFSFKPIV